MSLQSTITENDVDAASKQLVQSFRDNDSATRADLDVDGLSDSILSRLISLFSRSS